MTATTQIAKAAYRLTGIVKGAGNCDACGRELSQRVFTVAHKETGATLDLGRRCAAKATGYPTTAIERQAAMALRIAEVARRRKVVAAEFPQFSAVTDFNTAEYHLIGTAVTEDMFWNGGRRDGEWRDYLNHHNAR